MKNRITKGTWLTIIACVFLFAGSLLGAYLLFEKNNIPSVTPAIEADETIQRVPTPTPTGPRQDMTLLLLGYGGKGHPGGSLSDVIILVRVNPVTKKITYISIPRDLWIAQENNKLNTYYAKGGGNAAKVAVSMITGLPVDYYAAVSFEGFEKAIDTIGPITVKVPVTFDDYFYPVKGLENELCGKSGEETTALSETLSGFELEKQFPCRYEQLHFNKGEQEMNGKTALKFVRSRHSDQHGGDFARSERQQAVLEGIRNKLFSPDNILEIPKFMEAINNSISTDLTLQFFEQFILKTGDLGQYETIKVQLTKDNVLVNGHGPQGQYTLQPKAGADNYAEIHLYIGGQIQ